jgi:hypothetical protein
MVVVGTSTARAQTELVVTSGTSTLTFTGSSISTGPLSVGGWSLSAIGDTNSPLLHPIFGIGLDTLRISCTDSACVSNPLTLTLSSQGFTQPTDNFTAGATALRVTAGITYTSNSYWDVTNSLGGTTTLINTHTITGPAVGEDEISSGGGSSGPGPYSLTLVDVFTATTVGAGMSSATSDIAATPEPSTMLLFGLGLLLFGTIVRRKQSARAKTIALIPVA